MGAASSISAVVDGACVMCGFSYASPPAENSVSAAVPTELPRGCIAPALGLWGNVLSVVILSKP